MDNKEEFEEFEKRVRKELIPKIADSSIFVSITPKNKDGVDIKFALELGLAIMFDKPIIATIRPGTEIPEKLSKVVDRFVEIDFDEHGKPDATAKDRLSDAIQEVIKESKRFE